MRRSQSRQHADKTYNDDTTACHMEFLKPKQKPSLVRYSVKVFNKLIKSALSAEGKISLIFLQVFMGLVD
ncbi:CLUMA_CG012471, isoform A [Clunio marinus]|uniref:CLUMA_CG012471, isoform A n=1 Tax=Clunio marinus TaxID=568069 RepID=A0A1J1IE92_9DIPT|nr:CLUMA_CG012471, isoform A [Clunio marinus]